MSKHFLSFGLADRSFCVSLHRAGQTIGHCCRKRQLHRSSPAGAGVNDAHAVRDGLKAVGFDVDLVENGTKRQMSRAFSKVEIQDRTRRYRGFSFFRPWVRNRRPELAVAHRHTRRTRRRSGHHQGRGLQRRRHHRAVSDQGRWPGRRDPRCLPQQSIRENRNARAERDARPGANGCVRRRIHHVLGRRQAGGAGPVETWGTR